MNLEALLDSRKLASLKTLLREKYISKQRAKKVLSDSPGLVDLADFCSQLARWASAGFGGNSNYGRIVINPANQKRFWG